MANAIEGDKGGGGVGFSEVAVASDFTISFDISEVCRTWSFPNVLSGLAVEGDEVLHVDAVHGEDDEVFVKDEGGAGAAEVLAGEVAAFPDFFAGLAVERGGAIAAEVDVDVIGIDGGGAGAVAIDVVAEGFGIGVFEEEEVVEFFTGGFVEADGEHFFAIGGGIGDPDLIAHDDGGGPSAAGDGGFPDDVFGLGPFGGEAVGFAIGAGWVEAIVVRATKGGPVGEGGTDENCEEYE